MKKLLLPTKAYACIIICIFGLFFHAYGMRRLVEVPKTLKIGNLKLTITKGARRQIQTRIYKLLRNTKNFEENLSRFKSYSPILENILKEEGLPIDFKYLPVLESNLIATTRNSFGGAGFWQLKDSMARQNGLEVNDKVDERMNIAASTRGAAYFLRKNNLYFKNWVYTILTLHMGFESTKDFIQKNYNKREIVGAQELYIEERTHSFIKKFLAYKIAFEEKAALFSVTPQPLMRHQASGKTLAQIARKFKVSTKLLKTYNPWLKRKRIPRNNLYDVIIPLPLEGHLENVENNAPPIAKNQETGKNKQRLEAEFHKRAKNKFLAETLPLPKPQIVIKNIENDHKKYPNIAQVVEKNDLINDKPQITIKQNADNPVSYELVKPSYNNTIEITEIKPHTNKKTVNRQEDIDNPLPPVNHPVVVNQVNTHVNERASKDKSSYNTTEQKFFPSGLQPRHDDKFINPNTPQAGIHVVAEGQTVFNIARRYNISVSDLRHWNYINNDIYIGQKLVVAPPKTTDNAENQTSLAHHTQTMVTVEKRKTFNFNRSKHVTTKTRTYVHVVIRGQSLKSIADAYGVNAEDIKAWNNLRSSVIHMGQKVVIFKVIRLLQHASPIVKGQFFKDRKQTPLKNKLMHQQSKSLRKVMSSPYHSKD